MFEFVSGFFEGMRKFVSGFFERRRMQKEFLKAAQLKELEKSSVPIAAFDVAVSKDELSEFGDYFKERYVGNFSKEDFKEQAVLCDLMFANFCELRKLILVLNEREYRK